MSCTTDILRLHAGNCVKAFNVWTRIKQELIAQPAMAICRIFPRSNPSTIIRTNSDSNGSAILLT